MKIYLTLLIFLLISNWGFSREYTITDFPSKFICKISYSNDQSEEYFKKGIISVKRISDGKEIINFETDCITIDTKNDRDEAQDITLKDQGVVVLDDFNFDDIKDLALCKFFSSKGPSYSIFVFSDSTYNLDSALTEIIENSQGNYNLDYNSKTISTMSSGGCCWHSFSTYKFINGVAKPQSMTIEEVDIAFKITTTKKWVDGKVIESEKRTVDLTYDGIKEVLSFNLLGKDKRVVLYNINNRTLNYVLIRGTDIPEFYFPLKTVYKNRDFIISNSGNKITFNNKNVQYQIYKVETSGIIQDLGVLVRIDGKEYNLKGDIDSYNADFDIERIVKLDNVYNE